MATTNKKLTNQFQVISSKAAFIQSRGGNFEFAFGTNAPSPDVVNHSASEIYVDGTLGQLWAKKQNQSDVILVISEAE